MADQSLPALRRAAERAADQPFFLAGLLRAYAAAHKLDDAALAAWLGCATNDLPRLALCRQPGVAPADFRTDIEHLAQRFGLHAEQLAHLIREVEALQALQRHPARTQHSRHVLRAARDRDEADDEDAEASQTEDL
jgi:hypothetical protein